MKNIKALEHLIKDKNVALIGNSRKLLEKHYSVDEYDIVIRMNRSWDLSADMKNSVGTKLDILCLSSEQSELNEIFEVVETVVWMTPKHREKFSDDEREQLYFYPESWWDELHQKLRSRPSTGCMAFDLVRRTIGEGQLTLYGFDFFKTPNWYNQQSITNRVKAFLKLKKTGSPHSWVNEEHYIRNCSKERGFKIEKL